QDRPDRARAGLRAGRPPRSPAPALRARPRPGHGPEDQGAPGPLHDPRPGGPRLTGARDSVAPVENPFSWSASRHDTFATCRRRYYYSYYAAPEDPEIKRLKKLSALPLWAGSVVHETIETFLRSHDALPSPEERSEERRVGKECRSR